MTLPRPFSPAGTTSEERRRGNNLVRCGEDPRDSTFSPHGRGIGSHARGLIQTGGAQPGGSGPPGGQHEYAGSGSRLPLWLARGYTIRGDSWFVVDGERYGTGSSPRGKLGRQGLWLLGVLCGARMSSRGINTLERSAWASFRCSCPRSSQRRNGLKAPRYPRIKPSRGCLQAARVRVSVHRAGVLTRRA